MVFVESTEVSSQYIRDSYGYVLFNDSVREVELKEVIQRLRVIQTLLKEEPIHKATLP